MGTVVHPTLLVSVALDRTLLISVLWGVGTVACHCSPSSEVTKYECPTPEWGHARLCQQLHTWQVVAHARDVPLASWASRSPHAPAALGKARVGWSDERNLSSV